MDQTVDVGSDLKRALRGLAASVVIVATADESGKRYAMAATAVTPVSMDPPSMLMCVNRNASSHPVLFTGTDFSLNVLAADQMDVAKLCGGAAKGDERFAAGGWTLADNGIPYLADAQAVIHCTQRERFSYGSHDIFIGDVHRVILARDIDPMLYVDGQFRRIGAIL
ncbi:flavin reductase family protein [Sphingobium subterraneum]|uniref:Flavin reductase (DIM6/NTAB) family NADH-FMN oxidoreductase RutF n=1 Tax=Sphingobium subterraneum TaxID=627688 RepID=A0A841IY04_9SPHN|nr:flavin reductase family protein [Sphingobium subterraneum]MBB6123497.1 flavin reductase (DIM6/NTAB) family NADH-FMN oxidoreductase RutF [Sphingobium subterraneum]